jgi:chromosome partitioning protein
MAKIIVIGNQKGGVAKSVTVINTAHALAKYFNKKILIIDCDPQNNTSQVMGKVAPYDQARTITDIFEGGADMNITSCAVPSKYKNIWLIASNLDAFTLEDRLGRGNPKQFIGLKNKYDAGAREFYDFILIDCRPDISGLFVNNALALGEKLIMPVGAEDMFALKGVQQFMEAVRIIREDLNPDLEFFGALITMYDSRTNTSKAMLDAITQHFGRNKVFKTVINRNTAINKASIEGISVIEYDTRATGAHDYKNFAQELLTWLERENK